MEYDPLSLEIDLCFASSNKPDLTVSKNDCLLSKFRDLKKSVSFLEKSGNQSEVITIMKTTKGKHSLPNGR
jgi:hypothetical protein